MLADLLVAQELLDGLPAPLVAEGRTFAFDDGQGDAVHDNDHVRDDLFLGPLEAVLARDYQLVLAGVIEVEEANRLPLLAVAEILFRRDTVGQDGVGLLRGGEKTGRLNRRHRTDGLVGVVIGQPGVEPPKRPAQPPGEDVFLEGFPLGFEDLGRDTGVAKRLKNLDSGIFREVQLAPVLAGRHGLPWHCSLARNFLRAGTNLAAHKSTAQNSASGQLRGQARGNTLHPMTLNFRGQVQGGRLVVDEPIDMPDGCEVVLSVVEDSDDLDDEDRAQLHDAIRAGQAEMDAGKGIPAADVIARLCANSR